MELWQGSVPQRFKGGIRTFQFHNMPTMKTERARGRKSVDFQSAQNILTWKPCIKTAGYANFERNNDRGKFSVTEFKHREKMHLSPVIKEKPRPLTHNRLVAIAGKRMA